MGQRTTITRQTWLGRGRAGLVICLLGGLAGTGYAEPAPGLKERLTIDLGGEVKLELVLIQPGSFPMGSDKGQDDEQPVHKVTITRPFYLGKYLVTQEQWKSVMGRKYSRFYFLGARCPAEHLSWEDCNLFCQKLQKVAPNHTFRLPTEAEWEYACRAGSTTEFSYGDHEAGLGKHAWYWENNTGTAPPVGQKKPNPWGLYDIHGYVWEWCQDWYGKYAASDATDPAGPASGPGRVLRGGSWFDPAKGCRSASRYYADPRRRLGYFGVRVAAEVR